MSPLCATAQSEQAAVTMAATAFRSRYRLP